MIVGFEGLPTALIPKAKKTLERFVLVFKESASCKCAFVIKTEQNFVAIRVCMEDSVIMIVNTKQKAEVETKLSCLFKLTDLDVLGYYLEMFI